MSKTLTPHRGLPGVEESLLPAQAARMMEAALMFCCQKTAHSTEGEVAAALKNAEPRTHDCFRHQLGLQIAEYLARLDENLLGAYSYNYGDAEEEGEDRTFRPTEPLKLMLRVRRRTAALNAAVAALDQALLAEYRKLIAPAADRMAAFLDAHLIDDREAERGIGMGVILRSAFTPPTPVWLRSR